MIGRKRGPVRVELGLRALGVSKELAQSAIGQVLADHDVLAEALLLGEKRWKRLRATSDVLVTKKKVYDFLVRRGFQRSTAGSVIDRLEKEYDES